MKAGISVLVECGQNLMADSCSSDTNASETIPNMPKFGCHQKRDLSQGISGRLQNSSETARVLYRYIQILLF
jgi:hypothetical protein